VIGEAVTFQSSQTCLDGIIYVFVQSRGWMELWIYNIVIILKHDNVCYFLLFRITFERGTRIESTVIDNEKIKDAKVGMNSNHGFGIFLSVLKKVGRQWKRMRKSYGDDKAYREKNFSCNNVLSMMISKALGPSIADKELLIRKRQNCEPLWK